MARLAQPLFASAGISCLPVQYISSCQDPPTAVHSQRSVLFALSMSLQDLLNFAPVPGLASGVAVLTSTYKEVQNVKLYKQRCRELSGRCLRLMVALQESSRGLEGTRTIEVADEMEILVSHIDRKVREWASWTQLRSFLHQGEIKEGIERLHNDIDSAMMKFHIQVSLELSHGQHLSRAMQERDKIEMRELLQKIVKDTDNMKALLDMQATHHGSDPVEEVMESLQTELMDPTIEPSEEEAFKAGLWLLHEETSRLPPLTDLTGQVTLLSGSTVRKGSFNDVYLGQWLGQESVALRLPRMLGNDPEVQQRFQQEIAIWRELKHVNVVPLYGVVHIGEDLYTVSPWMDNGLAVDYIKKNPSAERLQLLIDAASGLEYLHSKGIVHGDLRGANLLVSREGIVSLSDFGLSKFLEDCNKGMVSSGNTNPRWSAPELVKQSGPLSTHSDVWGFAMVCLEILSGEVPYSSISRDIAVLREVDNGKLPQRPPGRFATSQGLSDDVWALMLDCWHKKPEMRPSITQIKARLSELRGVLSHPGPNQSGSSYDRHPTPSRDATKSLDLPARQEFRPSTAPSRSIVVPSFYSVPQNNPLSSQGSRPSTAPSKSTVIPSFNSVPRGPSQQRRGYSNGSQAEVDGMDTLRLDYNSTASSSRGSIRSRNNNRPELVISCSSPPTSPSRVYQLPLTSRSGSTSSPNSLISSLSGLSTDSRRDTIPVGKLIINIGNDIVLSGTLEGLINHLITNFNLRRDGEYREVFLATCTDFSPLQNVFEIVSHRFYEAEENLIAIQHNVFLLIAHILSNDRQLGVDHALLVQMRLFCKSIVDAESPTTVIDKARDTLKRIEETTRRQNLPFGVPLLPRRKPLQAPDITPHDLAIALTLLEGDKYSVLSVPSYIAHLRRRPGYNHIEGVYSTNNRIILWVKDSILHYDSLKERADVMKFFIHTAYECRKLRNFSSLIAIATALHSVTVERLRYTREALSMTMQSRMDALQDIIDPSSNHRSYRAALNEGANANETQRCVPWLAIHLKELNLVFERYPPTIQVDGRPLINFERYYRFMKRVREVLYYKVPDLEQYRHQGQLEYLQNRLRDLELTNVTEDQQITRGQELELLEYSEYHDLRGHLKSLGFKVG